MQRKIESVFFYLEDDVKGMITECIITIDREVIAFDFYKLGEKFLIKQRPFEAIVENKLKKEIDCVWVKMDGEPIMPIKCEMLVNSESGATILNLIGATYFFGFQKGLLQEYIITA